VNPQELFIDVSSGRFLDGQTPIATAKPNFFSDENRSVNLTVLRVKNNIVRPVTPAQNSRYKMRIGTAALKLADATDTPTASPILFTAQAAATTAPASQATGLGVVFNYTAVTAQFEPIVSTQSAVTALFDAKLYRVTPVTAAITVGITTTTQHVQEFLGTFTTSQNLLTRISNDGFFRMPGAFRTLSLSATLNSPAPAIFSTTAVDGVVTTVGISVRGFGYPNGSYAISFSGASTAGTITASATAVASGGSILSVTLNDGGSGYSGAPSATLFTPEKQVSSFTLGDGVPRAGTLNGNVAFRWAEGTSSVSIPAVPLRFSAPDATSTTIPLTTPSAFVVWEREDIWSIRLVSGGYGYVNTPTVTHDTATVGSPVIEFDDSNGVTTNINRSGTMLIEHGGAAISYYGVRYIDFDNLFNTRGFALIGTIEFPGIFQNVEPFQLRQGLFDRSLQQSFPQRLIGTSFVELFILRASNAEFGTALRLPPVGTRDSDFDLNAKLAEISESTSYIVGTGVNGRCPLFAIETPRLKEQKFKIDVTPLGSTEAKIIVDTAYNKGGIFNAKIKYLDGGSIHVKNLGGFRTIKNLNTGTSLLETPVVVSATVPTTNFLFQGSGIATNFCDTIFSQFPTVATRQGVSFTDYYLASGGFGFFGNGYVKFTGVTQTTGGIVVTASLTNTPIPYLDGVYECDVQSPTVGTKARIDFIVQGGRGRVVVLDGGAGYTSKPVVTAPNPNGLNGFITSLSLKNKPVGYQFDVPYKLTIGASPVTGGNCEAIFTVVSAVYDETIGLLSSPFTGVKFSEKNIRYISGRQLSLGEGVTIDTILISDNRNKGIGTARYKSISAIINRTANGFGYLGAPTVTAPAPDSEDIGNLVGLILKNSPQGYIPNKQYELEIENSPNIGGSAVASFTISEAGILSASISDAGFGYTSKPVVTAPGPDQRKGIITSAKKTFSGAGYGPGVYKCDVAEAPSGGETAAISLEVTEDGASRFFVESAGFGYVTAPVVTAPLQPGNIIRGITITCQGSFYAPNTATFSIIDSSGFGAVAGTPLLFSGKINNIQILNNGYGYSDTPIIEFGAPTEPVITDIQASQVQGDFNITTASANAILTTANQRDVLLEVYETDGTNEQVVVQGTVNLAKRVLE